MFRILRLLTLLIFVSEAVFGQAGAGEIYGRVVDDKNQPLDFVSVAAIQGDIVKGGGKTDLNGNYRIKPLQPGSYSLRITYVGYQSQLITDIVVLTDKRKEQNVKLQKPADGKELKEVIIKAERALIDPGDPGTKAMDKEIIAKSTSFNALDVLSNQGGTYQRKQGEGMSIGGDRANGTRIMIDGMMVRAGSITLPPNAINEMLLLTNGISAKYGNATGGFPIITTRGITSKLQGSLNAQHSIDGFNNNLVSGSLSGPLLKMKRKGKTYKEPIMGFSVNASLTYDQDNNPSYLYYRLKPETLKRLEENPLMLNPNGNGVFVKTSEMTTASDFERIRRRENGTIMGSQILSKIDIQPTSQMSVRIGSLLEFSRNRGYSNGNSLFAPDAHSRNNANVYRNYILFTHRLGKPTDDLKRDEKKTAISNAYYSIQFTYQKERSNSMNNRHLKNYFDYGYLGNFVTNREDLYFTSTDTATGYVGQRLLGQVTNSIDYTPGGKNPLIENYTKTIFNYSEQSNNQISNLIELQALGGLRNGDSPAPTYSLFSSPGAQITGAAFGEADQATLNIDASLDIEQGKRNQKGKPLIIHNIQFGLGYDQRTTRSYTVSRASGLWTLMRLLANRHIQNYDLANPIFLVGGNTYDRNSVKNVDFSVFDTIKYNRLYDGLQQSRFDKELRKKLYGNEQNLDLIDVDSYDPSTFSLSMFSADDVFNQGQDYTFWSGYDYLGNKVRKQPSFNDFWTKKDARGDYLRPIGAFRPIYMFGYILDQFSYKDLNFNIGVRIDRYDANQKVLKDPYSLYGVLKAGDIQSGTYKTARDINTNQLAPDVSSFDKDYVVYVNDNQSSKPTVVGYRKGDTWFDPFGKEIQDPSILSGLYASGLPIQPWLLNKNDSIKSASFNPNNSFEDYKPQISVSPRIQFTFPISENSLLYGNYDVVTQQPSSSSFVTPDDYYFMKERQATIGNANLQMERGVNYSLGFQQTLGKRSVMTIEAYYRERRNQIQLQRFFLAYPITYTSFGNRDFSSTTGTTVKLEFRRPVKKPIRMDINYTLQFAEGTGSNTQSQRSLLSSGQPNLRTLFPLAVDSRHVLNVILDYRYQDGNGIKGPKIGKIYPFQNTGINLNFRTRSGEPYTRFSQAVPLTGGDFNSSPIVGTVSGSRLPWNYEFNTRIDKDIFIGKGKNYLNIYMIINNILNTKNVLGVYSFSGLATDDAYLTSPQGIQALSNVQFQQAFVDQYTYTMWNSGALNNPRRIFVGFNFNF